MLSLISFNQSKISISHPSLSTDFRKYLNVCLRHKSLIQWQRLFRSISLSVCMWVCTCSFVHIFSFCTFADVFLSLFCYSINWLSKNNKQSTTHVIYTPHNLFIYQTISIYANRSHYSFFIKATVSMNAYQFFLWESFIKSFFQLKKFMNRSIFFILFIDMFVLNLNLNVESFGELDDRQRFNHRAYTNLHIRTYTY